MGSSLLAQGFTSPQYFQPRPSAVDYNASGSAASNLGPNSADLAAAVKERVAAVSAADGIAAAAVPVDLVTTSGSGLDPDISRQGALVQVDRVAKARGLDPAVVRALVLDRMQSPTLGLLGTTRVNVLELNLALDRMHALIGGRLGRRGSHAHRRAAPAARASRRSSCCWSCAWSACCPSARTRTSARSR